MIGTEFKALAKFVKQPEKIQGPHSLTILENILGLVLQIFLYLEAFECSKTSDWLNHTV